MKEKGDAFEAEVEHALRLIPRANVQRHVRILGKNVDTVLELRGAFGETRRIAVECKDYDRRLNRDQVSDILKDYYPLINARAVNAIILATRNGIVDNAADMFDGDQFIQIQYSDLLARVLDLTPLAHEMCGQFANDSLAQYYEPVRIKSVEYELAKSHLAWYENPYADWASQSSFAEDVMRTHIATSKLRDQWRQVIESIGKPDYADFASMYEPKLLAKIVADKKRTDTSDLDDFVRNWLNDGAADFGLAILGSYGTGKSSYARALAHRLASSWLQGRSERVPLLIELRRFSVDQDIEGLVTNELANRNAIEGATFSRFQLLNRAGKFVVILDGLDEMKYGMSRDALARSMAEIAKLSGPSSKVILCGRPTIFEDSLDQFHVLQESTDGTSLGATRYLRLHVSPLPQNRIAPLVRNYSLALGGISPEDSRSRTASLARSLRRGGNLADLLSRPVHIPMFVKILPELDGRSISQLGRGELYDRFIAQSIRRETPQEKYLFANNDQRASSVRVEISVRDGAPGRYPINPIFGNSG